MKMKLIDTARLLRCGRFGCVLALLAGSATLTRAQLYSQNFDGGAATGWLVATGGGTWQVSGGTDKVYESVGLTAGPEVSYYNGATWTTNYTYTADVRLWGSGTGNEVGLVYAFQDINNYYELQLNNQGTARLFEHVGGSGGSTPVATGTFSGAGGGVWVTVAIERGGTSTTVKVNGATVITRTQTALTGSGRIGVVDRFAGGRFNNITISDTAPPTVAITAPPDGSTQSGTISVSAAASDDVGVAGVQFRLDSANLGAEDTSPPYAVSWNTTAVANGTHVLTAVARDTANNTTTSAGVFVNVSNGSLPAPWLSQDIGSVGAAGSVNHGSGTYTVAGAGAGIWNSADEFRFVYQPFSGDCTLVARVASVQNTGGAAGWEHGGVMIRESLAAGSAFAGLYETSTRGILFEKRNSTGIAAVGVAADSANGPPHWLRLARTGNTFVASRSSDGVTWTTVGSTTIAMASSTFYVGLAVTSQVDATTSTAVFDNVSVTSGTVGAYKTSFPKVAGILFNKTYDDTAFQQVIAGYDIAILGFYKGWARSGLTIRQAVQQIKAIRPAVLVGNYTILESAVSDINDTATAEIRAALNGGTGPTGNGGTWTPNDWWAHTHTGARASHFAGQEMTNITEFTTPDANGDRFPQWYAKWANTAFFAPVPEFDFVFSDNAFWRPRLAVDWDRSSNTTDDANTDPNVQAYFRRGMAAYWAQLNALQPGKLIMGNSDGQTTANAGYLREPEYSGKLGAALYETAFGRGYSEENYSGWYNMMTSYQTLLDNTASPHLVVVGAACTTDGKAAEAGLQANYGGGAAFAFARYVLASVLMKDGYVELHPNTYANLTPVWLDEYDLAGTASTSWLGAPIDPPPTAPYQNGVFRRRFQNGMAIVNPRTNPNLTLRVAETITPEAGYKRFVGTQDPVTNNGANVTTITIQPGDGILLIKQ